MGMRIRILDTAEEGRRLRQLRRLAAVPQSSLSPIIGFKEGTSSNISKVENGKKRLSDVAKKKVANFLAGKGDLRDDPKVLFAYLVGDHDSLTQCIEQAPGESPDAPTGPTDGDVAPTGFEPVLPP